MKKLFILIALLHFLIPAIGKELPKFSPNPWKDDYTPVSKMDNWKSWGTYNVHDPSCKKLGDRYYMYSTDAIFHPSREEARRKDVPTGFIPVRRSENLVDWEMIGWVFDSIPSEAVEWVRSQNNGRGATNIWAPYIMETDDGKFRLYYCVSAFGKKTSYIGLAEAEKPEGPWVNKGAVVKTDSSSKMNAIDPSVITDKKGRQWMHYGSYFGGTYCVELDPSTGFPLTPGDQGHLVARRANWRKDNLEAPEIYYHEANGEYYLFYSYEPLMTTYNVRVARSKNAEGPFYDFFGKEISDTTNNFPVLTAAYEFDGHPGWVGVGHCGVFDDQQDNVFMVHQGRYAPNSGLMDLHLRQVFFTPDGWPVVSPERYVEMSPVKFSKEDLEGEWEIIRIREPRVERNLEAGQILWGEGALLNGEGNASRYVTLNKNDSSWNFDSGNQILSLTIDGEEIKNLIIHPGHDWERETDTILFTGLDPEGRSVWGKLVDNSTFPVEHK